ncbi:hypothetical protein PIIN_07386 [Serendipita indica DSM 11827]|uniref:Uncharacterized protein n=1 Tax=Serendipita indica (strain DSM 11827) TaxID=1109443 RepID=G4TQ39_SERID|nr:hypothetical protein PIIN_07386 [Serendipita indica DSM 11827]
MNERDIYPPRPESLTTIFSYEVMTWSGSGVGTKKTVKPMVIRPRMPSMKLYVTFRKQTAFRTHILNGAKLLAVMAGRARQWGHREKAEVALPAGDVTWLAG